MVESGDPRIQRLIGGSALVVAVLTLGLGVLRRLLVEDSWSFLILIIASAAFAITAFAAWRGRETIARWLLPLIGLLGTGGGTIAEGGLLSEFTFWLPLVPLLGVWLLGIRRATVFVVTSMLLVTGLAAGHQFTSLYPKLSEANLLLRYASITGALGFSIVLGLAYERSREQASAELKRAHQRLQALVHNLPAGVAITDENALLISANQRLCDIFGISESPESLVGRDTWALLSSGSQELASINAFKAGVLAMAEAGIPVENEVRMTDGTVYELDFTPLMLQTGATGYMWSYHDITAHKIREERLLSDVQRDDLTGLATKSHFTALLTEACDAGRSLGVLFLDLDGFKEVNDSHGHDVGDRVLAVIAERLQASTRAEDVVARFGGDEFAILLSGTTSLAGATRRADKLIENVSGQIVVGSQSVQVGASVGVVIRSGTASAAKLLKAADAAMYQAKRAGKGVSRAAS